MTDVLVIEDDDDIRGLIVSKLERLGCTVREAVTGEAGMGELHRPPDLLVLDVLLPGIDGWEVLRRVRATEATARVPVLVLTIERPESIPDLEPGEFLPKPFAARRFEETVRRLLGGHPPQEV
ncbi:response regulator [Nitriliruptor alkaliphilus]|uniref:response regulator n=1 Tax=Nitriliruptor alkaliphilus TaxID=427918 RepID=UPI000697EE09|nr:response regulator [Nitriliruptor alkaliphilus]